MFEFAVFGDPISHSLSPQIHEAFGKQFDLKIRYERIHTRAGELQIALAKFKQQGGLGANITVPLKHEAFQLCQQVSARATKAQAVNTIGWTEQGELWGDNTDGEGLIRDLTVNHQLTLTHKSILLLGSGGAAAGILEPLLSFSPSLTVASRDLEKAKKMLPFKIKSVLYEMLADEENVFDYIINATSASLYNEIPPIPLHYFEKTCCIDLAYRLKEPTVFLQVAKDHGASYIYDGLGMLVEQAALGFAKWHAKVPETQSVIKQLRQ
ncbi:shikimate dehydrogenase [Candidatus Berkiella aquae]|uniref:Shikimate dehydrogenase (NADP(+)) n=1 Tax=Candidatus Berkiella aquae TaxID=295108 RepID=A0A0Q9YLX1_9GAMM|nr:shikimate dehydrogenase [Candidatus Berkiella aquae]MCS5709819.1 shikimate dehydrogenase [Candidatus Berkiella aquae]